MGTPGYMAPEQAVGDQLDHRADLYALGVVLWEAIAGRDLWTGEDITAIIAKQMREDAPPLRSVIHDPTIPEDLEDLLQQLMARNAADRPEHPGDVRDALRALSLAPAGDWGLVKTRGQTRALRPNELTGVSPVSGWLRQTLAPYPKLQDLSQRAAAELRTTPRVLLAAVVAAAVLLMGLLLSQDDEEEPNMVAPVTTDAAASAPAAQPSGSKAGSQKTKAKASANEGILDKVVNAASNAVKPALEAAITPPPKPVPAGLEETVEELLDGPRLRVRRAAARKVLEYEPRADIPEYLIPIAQFEATSRCAGRREALQAMVAVGDRRARPIVERYHDSPASGCGFLGMSDCYRCIRADLRETLDELPAGSADAADPETAD